VRNDGHDVSEPCGHSKAQMKLLTRDEARRIVATVAKLPRLGWEPVFRERVPVSHHLKLRRSEQGARNRRPAMPSG
jgi:hypothetical protein